MRYFRAEVNYRDFTEKDINQVTIKWYDRAYRGDLLKSYTVYYELPQDDTKEYNYNVIPYIIKDLKELVTDKYIDINKLYEVESTKNIEDTINNEYLYSSNSRIIIEEYM